VLKNPDDEGYATQEEYDEEEESEDNDDNQSNDTDYWAREDNSEGPE
jgi:hypothetical protein